MEETKNLDRLKKAWENAPQGVKVRLYSQTGYSDQNIRNILRKGRKDQQIILDVLDAVKKISNMVAKEVNDQNQTVQSV